MQPDLGLPFALPPPQRPMHPRQGVKEAAVLNEPRPFGRGAFRQIPRQALEHLGQRDRIDQMLGFGKTAQADRPDTSRRIRPKWLAAQRPRAVRTTGLRSPNKNRQR